MAEVEREAGTKTGGRLSQQMSFGSLGVQCKKETL